MLQFINPRARAIGAALIILPPLLWLSLRSEPEILESEALPATVLQVREQGQVGNERSYELTFRLEDGESVSLTLREPVPAQGDTVTLLRETIQTGRNSEVNYRFERQAWELGE